LRQISDYSRNLNVEESNPEKKVGEFISFLPVLAYDGSTMKQVDAADILDIAMAGTSATLLARRWESAMLVNVDNDTLARLMANPDAMAALMRIEGFRTLNNDIETIINKSEAVKKAKKDGDEHLSPKEKKDLTDAEKEYKSKRKEIQEKLIKFATRIPIFMYLTDFREYSLKDVITKLEPGLFRKVTGLEVKDFELLVSLGVFNGPVMDDAVYKFRRYEDSSLSYTGINRHENEQQVGLYSTSISREDYERMAAMQSSSITPPSFAVDDRPDSAVFTGDFSDAEDSEDPAEVSAKSPTRESIVKPATTIFPVVRHDTHRLETAQKQQPFEAMKVDRSSVDYSAVSIGSQVLHAKFGTGKVCSIENAMITVDFSGGTKKFPFPDAIENGFLSIDIITK